MQLNKHWLAGEPTANSLVLHTLLGSALLFRKNRLVLPAQHSPTSYLENIVEPLGLNILPLTPAIAALAESGIVTHGDPGDRLIAATAIAHQVPLITADEKLRAMPGLHCIW